MIYLHTERRMTELRLSKKIERRIEDCANRRICMACSKPIAEGEEIVRQCHVACYRAMNRLFREGRVDERQAIADGQIAPASPGGRKPTNPVTQRFSEAG